MELNVRANYIARIVLPNSEQKQAPDPASTLHGGLAVTHSSATDYLLHNMKIEGAFALEVEDAVGIGGAAGYMPIVAARLHQIRTRTKPELRRTIGLLYVGS
jgi:hypothetical protein